MRPKKDDNKKIRTISAQKWVLFAAGCLLGAFLFAVIYGLKIVDPGYDAWIMERNGDVTQHYLGWVYYRNSSWRLPLGLIEGIQSNGDISCIYTDSIPILAVFFKLLSPVLPETFQYTGLWELLCYTLMGGLSTVLVSRFSKDPFFCLAGSIPFIISPTVLARALGHEALSGQWIIIAALILWVWRDKKWKHKATPVVLWTVLGVISVLVHLYFIPLIYMVMSGYILCDLILDKKVLRPALIFTSTTVVSVAMLFLFGAFYGDPPMAGEGLCNYASNYNAYFNSYGFSKFLKPLDTACESTEGFGYLGLGVLLMCVIAALVLFCEADRRMRSAFDKKPEKPVTLLTEGTVLLLTLIFSIRRSARLTILALAVMSIVLIIAWRMQKDRPKLTVDKRALTRRLVYGAVIALVAFESLFMAASPRGALFTTIIYDIRYPALVEKVLAIFRASGRFIWLSMYIIFIVAIGALARIKNKKAALLAVCGCAVLQYVDLSEWLASNNAAFDQTVYTHSCPIETEEFNELLAGKDEVVFLPLREDYLTHERFHAYFSFAEYAAKHGMRLSCFYTARADYYALEPYAREQMEMLSSGNGREDAVYVFLYEDAVADNSEYLDIYTADGLTFGVLKKS